MYAEVPKPPVVWTIAGFDPSSGAGVTADLMTFAAHGLFGCSVITGLTVQSTMGATSVHPVEPALLTGTFAHLVADLPPAGIKIGMLATAETAAAVAAFLRECKHNAQLSTAPVVLDPVLRSSSGRELYPSAAMGRLHAEVLPLVDWITPNWAELGELTGQPVQTADHAEQAGGLLQQQHPHLHLVVTGGDQADPTDLLFTRDGATAKFRGEHVETRSTHGTGCAFSSSLLSRLVLGATAMDAVGDAKAYVAQALRRAPGLGNGRGPLGLLWPLQGEL